MMFMFWVKFVLVVIWHTVNIPLRLLFSIVQRLLWFPHFNNDRKFYLDRENVHAGTIYDSAREYMKHFKLTDFRDNDDGAKFLGLSYYLQYSGLTNKDIWSYLKLYWDDETFTRRPKPIKSKVEFSGDMLSGMLFAIYYRKRESGLSIDEVDKLRKIFYALTFKNFFKFPQVGETRTRGYIFPIWAFGHEWMQVLAFLQVAYEVTKYKPYFYMYMIFRILSVPTDIAPYYGIYAHKVKAAAWYTYHTAAIYAHITSNVTTMELFSKMFFYNADICALCCDYRQARLILRGYTPDSKQDPEGEKKHRLYIPTRTFNLRGFKWEEVSDGILQYELNRQQYIWEAAPNKVQDESRGSIDYLDFLIPSTLVAVDYFWYDRDDDD